MHPNSSLDRAILAALRTPRFYNVTLETLLLSLPQVPEIQKHLKGKPEVQREEIHRAIGRLWDGKQIVFEDPIVRVVRR